MGAAPKSIAPRSIAPKSTAPRNIAPKSIAVVPRTLDQAVRFLAGDPELVPVAGCTDLMVPGARVASRFERVLDLLRVREIRGIRRVEGGWQIGATTSFAEIARSRYLRSTFPALAQAASQIGGWQIQNRATLGGNMANASPAGDSLPVLLALDAVVIAASAGGLREIPYGRFHLSYRKTALCKGEIIAWVRLRDPQGPGVQRFRKVGTRRAQAISKVVLAMAARWQEGRLADVRFGAGSVAPIPVRLCAAERACEGALPDASIAELAGAAASGEVQPIDDVRSTAAYRRFVLGRLVRRMVLEAGDEAP
ncbi:MAG: FAD binding domain-containing protein [Planctomycetota bacterium]